MPDDFAGLPELTLSLRSFGSSRGRAGEEQTLFFGPLLEARRRAADATNAAEAVAAFNVARLGAALDQIVRGMASDRFPDRPPARRAFEAALGDVLQPLYAALRALRDSTPAPASAHIEAAWVPWLNAVRATFETADRSWGAVDALLGQYPPPRASARGGRR